MRDYLTFKLPFTLSVLLHIVIVVCVLWVPVKHIVHKRTSGLEMSVPIQAQTVDAAKVEQEIANIKHQEKLKREQEQARVRAMNKKLAKIKSQRVQEQAKLKSLKQQQHQTQEKAHKDLAKLQQRTKQEQKQLQQLQKQQQKAKQAALEKQKHEVAKRKQAALEKQKRAAASAEQARQLARQKEKQARLHDMALQSEVDKYTYLIQQAISRRWIVPEAASSELTCQLLIRLAPGGTVLDVQLARTSGNSLLDRSARAAVYKASPLPVPSDAEVFDKFRVLRLTVHPESATA